MKQKNLMSLDSARLIAALLVVAIHVYPLASFNEQVDYLLTRVLFRIAVPLFIMITGYFVLPKIIKDNHALAQYIFKIIKIYVFALVLYLPLNIYLGYFSNNSLGQLGKDLLFNGSFYHLWYFPALILGLLLISITLKHKIKYPGLLFLILYIIGLFGDSYYGLIKNIPLISAFYHGLFMLFDYTRNGLFYVPLFLYLGYSFHKNKFNYAKHTYLLLFFVLLGIEGMILFYFNLPRHTSMYIFLLPMMYSLFKYLLSYPPQNNPQVRSLAMAIYIIHPLVIVLVHYLAKITKLSLLVTNSLYNYILVVALSVLMSIIWQKLKKLIIKV